MATQSNSQGWVEKKVIDNSPTIKLYIFDVDETLVEKWTENLLPGVKEWFQGHGYDSEKGSINALTINGSPITVAQSAPKDIRCVIATNQDGVGLRKLIESRGDTPGEKLPTIESVYSRMRNISKKLTGSEHELQIQCAFNYWDEKTFSWAVEYDGSQFDQWNPDFRKPSTGMIDYYIDFYDTDREDVIFVGDSEEDKEAARLAGVKFAQSEEFFRN